MSGVLRQPVLLLLTTALVPWGSARTAAAETKQTVTTALAVIAQGTAQETPAVGKLQALLESETAAQWPGRLVERDALAHVLRELARSPAAPEGSSSQSSGALHLGRLVSADLLLHAWVTDTSVRVTLVRSPDTEIVSEDTWSRDLALDSLAVRAVTQALRAARHVRLDLDTIRIGIGTFMYDDPHRLYLGLSDQVHTKLRRQLGHVENAVVVERFAPSAVLGELELARGGMAQPLWSHLSAPPADLLVVGEFKPVDRQPLENKLTTLTFRIRIISPTGLCPPQDMTFAATATDTDGVAAAAARQTSNAIAAARAAIVNGAVREPAEVEFDLFKEQALRLLPSAPGKDGVFYTSSGWRPIKQEGEQAELIRALRAVENAMLFKGDDTQLLVCAGALLAGLAGHRESPEDQRRHLHQAALDHIEKAYRLDDNPNTRGTFCWGVVANGKEDAGIYMVPCPDRSRALARHVLQTQHTVDWSVYELAATTRALVSMGPTLDAKISEFMPFARACSRSNTQSLYYTYWMLGNINAFVRSRKDEPRIRSDARTFADRLLREKSLYLRALGHYERLYISQNLDDLSADYVPNYRKLMQMLVPLHDAYGDEFRICNLTSLIYHGRYTYKKAISKHGLEDDSVALAKQFVLANVKVGNYNGVGSAHLVSREIVPELIKASAYREAYDLLTEFLHHYTVTGAGDGTRMRMAQLRNRCAAKLDGFPRQVRPAMSQLRGNWTRNKPQIHRLVRAGDTIWGVDCNRYFQGRYGHAFSFPVTGDTLTRLEGIEGPVSDVTYSPPFLAVTTQTHGLYVLNVETDERHHFTTETSPLPGNRVQCAAAAPGGFTIGIRDRENLLTHLYRVDCASNQFSKTGQPLSLDLNDRIQAVEGNAEGSPVQRESWRLRSCLSDGKRLTFTCNGLSRGIKQVTVGDPAGKELLAYTGVDLSYVNDIVLWQGQLIFATGNGLYISEPGTNDLRCLFSEMEWRLLSLCQTEEDLFIGSNRGVHRIGRTDFLTAVRNYPKPAAGPRQ